MQGARRAIAVSRYDPPFRVLPNPAGIEPELGIAQDVEERTECLAVRAVRPGNNPTLQFGYVVSVDRHIATGLDGDQTRHFFCQLAFGYAGRQASATETMID